MKRTILGPALALVAGVYASAQFNLPGGGIAGTGIPAFSSTASTSTYSGNANVRRGETVTPHNFGPGDPRCLAGSFTNGQGCILERYGLTPQQNAYYYGVFRHIFDTEGYTTQAETDWYNLAKATGWPVVYYNYAMTAWHLGQLSDAKKWFEYINSDIMHCLHAGPDGQVDQSVCDDAHDNEGAVENDIGKAYLQIGDYPLAEAAFHREIKLDGDGCSRWGKGVSEAHCDLSVPYYNLAIALHGQGRWEEANTAARTAWGAALPNTGYANGAHSGEWLGCNPCHETSPNLDKAIELVHTTNEDMDYAAAVKIVQSGGDLTEARNDLASAIYYDSYTPAYPPTERKFYNARAIWATILHTEGNDTVAEENADIVLLEHPGDQTAQLLLDTIHKKDLDEMQLHSPTAGGDYHWPNQCSRIVDPHINGYNLHCAK